MPRLIQRDSSYSPTGNPVHPRSSVRVEDSVADRNKRSGGSLGAAAQPEPDFLGLRYDDGAKPTCPRPEWRPGQRDGNWQCLIIANPTEILPTAAVEAAAVKESLEGKGIACDYLAGKDASFENVLHHLNSGHYDIIHYSGHIGREEESGEFGFLLYNSRFFYTRFQFGRTFTLRPSPSLNMAGNSGAVVQGLTEAFLSTGAQMVAGSLFNTPRPGSALLLKFYADFLRGVPAGEAMRQARLHVKEMENCGLSWRRALRRCMGSPFSLTVQSDELDAWLDKAGFQEGRVRCWGHRILQQAEILQLSNSRGFRRQFSCRACGGRRSAFLRQQLDRHGVLQLLKGAFKTALLDREKGVDGLPARNRLWRMGTR